MELTASKTASCTIAPQRAWKKGLVGGNDTVVCMIVFQSVTASACALPAPRRTDVTTIGIQSRLLIRFIVVCPFLGQRASLGAHRAHAGTPGRVPNHD